MMPRTSSLLHAALVFGNQGLNSVANLAISLFLVRVLGVAEFGVYAVYFAIAYGISAVCNALVASPLVSIASQKAPTLKDAMIASASFAFMSATLSLLLLATATDLLLWLFAGTEHATLLAAAFGVSMAAAEFVRRVAFLRGSAGMAWRFDVLRFGLLSIGFMSTLYLSDTTTTQRCVLIFTGANAVAVLVVLIPHVKSWMRLLNRRRMSGHMAHFLRSGAWLSVSSILQLTSDHMLLLVAAYIAGPFAAGAIKTCQTIVGVINPMLMALEHTIPKKLGEDMRRDGAERAGAAYRRTASIILILMASALGAVALAASPILRFVSGDELRGYENLLRLCCALWLMYPVTAMLSFVFRARNRTLPILLSQAVAAAFAVASGIPLIVEMGAFGAVLGTMLAQVTAICSLLIMLFRLEAAPLETTAR